MRIIRTLIIAVSLAWCASQTNAESQPLTGQSIDAFAFVSGSWEGPLFGGHGEEMWLPPREGTMACVFRLTWPDNDRKIYELFLVEETEAGEVMLTFRHFSPGMELWEREVEAPNTFYLVEAGERMARFDAPNHEQSPSRLVFTQSEGGQTLTVNVQSIDEAGEVLEGFDVVYTRVECDEGGG